MVKLFLWLHKLSRIPLYIYAMFATVYVYLWVLKTYKGVPDLNNLENRLAIDTKLEKTFGARLAKLHEQLITTELKLENKLL